MKKVLLPLVTLLIIIPTLCSASYIIHLKNGSDLLTSDFWIENKLIKFYYKGGVMGMDKAQIKSIENTDKKIIEEEPLKKEQDAQPPVKQKAQLGKKSPTELLQEKYTLLKEKHTTVNNMAPDELISLAKELMKFRDAVLKERLGSTFTEEIGSVYTMNDQVELLLTSPLNQ